MSMKYIRNFKYNKCDFMKSKYKKKLNKTKITNKLL